MKSTLNKLTSAAAATIVAFVGCVMAGLGLAMIAVLAMFSFAVFGLALIASPFVRMPDEDTHDIEVNVVDEAVKAA